MDAPSTLALASTVTALVGSVAVASKWAAQRYRKTFGSRAELRDRLSRVCCGVVTPYVDSLFGAPAMHWRGPEDLDQRGYWTKHGWLSTLTPSGQDMVWAFSFTVTDPKFTLATGSFTNALLDVALGRSRFSDAPRPNAWRFFEGSHNSEYVECYDFGNMGYYQVFFLGTSDAGVGRLSLRPLWEGGVATESGAHFGAEDIRSSEDRIPEQLAAFRRLTVPNTFVIVGPDLPFDIGKNWKPVGIHYERIRMFPSRARHSTQTRAAP